MIYFLGKPDVEFTDHLSDVKCCDWHPYRSLVASGSKDNAVKLFDPRCKKAVTTIHTHKNSILCCGWNFSGNLLATGSRDQLLKIFDIRACKEVAVLRGHDNQVTSLSWHPQQEALLVSGGYNGKVIYWVMGNEGPHSTISGAHNYSVNAILWHPLGHLVTTAANDGVCKFWSREPPGSTLEEELEEWQEPSNVVIEHGPLPPPAIVPTKVRGTKQSFDNSDHSGGTGSRRGPHRVAQNHQGSGNQDFSSQRQSQPPSHYQRQPPQPPQSYNSSQRSHGPPSQYSGSGSGKMYSPPPPPRNNGSATDDSSRRKRSRFS